MTITPFVFTKMGTEAGEDLTSIVARKEKERSVGSGIFWWGIGSSLGRAVTEAAQSAGGTLPVLFLQMVGRPQHHDVDPTLIFRWTKWRDWNGAEAEIPDFIRVTSRGAESKKNHYALVCHSKDPIRFDLNGQRFDPRLCITAAGRIPGSSQVTALVRGNLEADHSRGQYRIAFRATLEFPWQAKLVAYEVERASR
jgi:hypothetical protein